MRFEETEMDKMHFRNVIKPAEIELTVPLVFGPAKNGLQHFLSTTKNRIPQQNMILSPLLAGANVLALLESCGHFYFGRSQRLLTS